MSFTFNKNYHDKEQIMPWLTEFSTLRVNMEKSGQEQFAPYISHLEPGLTSATNSCGMIAVWHMKPSEAFNITESP